VPGALTYSLSGQTAALHHALLQKRNGSFFLALWQERSSYDTGARPNAPDNIAARGDRVVADQAVRLSVQNPIAAASVFRLDDAGTLSSTPVALTAGNLDLAVSDRVTVVELDPPGAVAAASTPNVPPRLTNVRVTPRAFSVKRHSGGRGRPSGTKGGTRFVYTLSEPATVRIAIDRVRPGRRASRSKDAKCVAHARKHRRGGRCHRYEWMLTLRVSKQPGRRSTSFAGVLRGRALKQGHYRARLTATDDVGAKSDERRLRFKIVRR
jgi:hypothetical protein